MNHCRKYRDLFRLITIYGFLTQHRLNEATTLQAGDRIQGYDPQANDNRGAFMPRNYR